MTAYVSLQEEIIRILRIVAKDDYTRLKHLVKAYCRSEKISKSKRALFFIDLDYLKTKGLVLPKEGYVKWVVDACLEIIREQLDASGKKIVIKNLLGSELYHYGPPIGYREYIKLRGGGSANRLRSDRFANPAALKKGNVLANGDRLLSPPREGGNGSVLLHLTGGFDGHWMGVPACIPIALLTKADKAPPGLVEK